MKNIGKSLKVLGKYALLAGVIFLTGYSLSWTYNLWAGLIGKFMELAFVQKIIEMNQLTFEWFAKGFSFYLGFAAANVVLRILGIPLLVITGLSQPQTIAKPLHGWAARQGTKIIRPRGQDET